MKKQLYLGSGVLILFLFNMAGLAQPGRDATTAEPWKNDPIAQNPPEGYRVLTVEEALQLSAPATNLNASIAVEDHGSALPITVVACIAIPALLVLGLALWKFDFYFVMTIAILVAVIGLGVIVSVSASQIVAAIHSEKKSLERAESLKIEAAKALPVKIIGTMAPLDVVVKNQIEAEVTNFPTTPALQEPIDVRLVDSIVLDVDANVVQLNPNYEDKMELRTLPVRIER